CPCPPPAPGWITSTLLPGRSLSAPSITIPADHLPQVLPQVHAGRVLAVDAYDRDLKNKLATGQVLAVDNQIDPTTGTVRIKALFANQNEALFPNQFVNARLLVDTLRGAV